MKQSIIKISVVLLVLFIPVILLAQHHWPEYRGNQFGVPLTSASGGTSTPFTQHFCWQTDGVGPLYCISDLGLWGETDNTGASIQNYWIHPGHVNPGAPGASTAANLNIAGGSDAKIFGIVFGTCGAGDTATVYADGVATVFTYGGTWCGGGGCANQLEACNSLASAIMAAIVGRTAAYCQGGGAKVVLYLQNATSMVQLATSDATCASIQYVGDGSATVYGNQSSGEGGLHLIDVRSGIVAKLYPHPTVAGAFTIPATFYANGFRGSEFSNASSGTTLFGGNDSAGAASRLFSGSDGANEVCSVSGTSATDATIGANVLPLLQSSTSANVAIGSTVPKWSNYNNGADQHIAHVDALPGCQATTASPNMGVGTKLMYHTANTISECLCWQSAAATYVWIGTHVGAVCI